jgi:hypothetical protein
MKNESEMYNISSTTALNVNLGDELPNMSKAARESAMDKFTEQKWLLQEYENVNY